MPLQQTPDTATIIAFPRGGQAAYERARIASAANVARAVSVVDIDGWYHQAAVDEERDRRN